MNYQKKRQELREKQQSAPTPALAGKFTGLLAKLDSAYAILSDASVGSEQVALNNATSHITSPLSQTKLDDLPGMAPADINRLSFDVGHVLAQRYTIKELIGQGGMGAVYRAHDKNRDEDIAIKILLPSLTNNERALSRFLDEARISSKLSHANIVNVYDVQSDGDLYFLTMELLEGQDLRQVMENQKLVGRPMAIEDIKGYLSQICEGLAAAHEHTVHRDIKPENIWLCDDGRIKLMDFGIAQLQSTSRRTQTGAAMGTAYYMAPEQLKGLKDIDGRADQYAVGVLAYELLTGEVPAGAIEPVEALRKDIPKGMAAAIMRALSPRPESRFESIPLFAEAVQKAKGKTRYKAANTSSVPISTGPNKWVVVAVVVLSLAGLGAIAGTGIWKDWMPASKEEIVQQKAAIAQLQGEISVLKQRLETSRRSLDSDLRDAQRNNSESLAALEQWQGLTEQAIFNSNRIAQLEGGLAVGQTLLREGSYADAHTALQEVRDGYQSLYDNFTAAGNLFEEEQAAKREEQRWNERAQDYGFSNSVTGENAISAKQAATMHASMGEFTEAQAALQQSTKLWQTAIAEKNDDVSRIDRERQAAKEAERQRAAARAEAKAAAERRAAAELAAKRKAAEEAKLARERQAAAERAEAEKRMAKPIVKIAPLYPRRAQSRGVEGYCEVEMTVGINGIPSNITPVDCSPSGYFEKSAVAAAAKFKYVPGFDKQGKPITQSGIRHRFDFTLAK
ncbi:MAG: TonB family protein [Pseudomonadota bacterium]|nr:TonB family protein [Pseudomonadota bacterium]